MSFLFFFLCPKGNRLCIWIFQPQNDVLYTWITRHPQVLKSPISNDCFKVMLDNQTEPQLVTKFLLQVSVKELHNSLISDPNDGGLKDARDEDGRIIISDSTLRSLLPTQLKQMYARYKVMCGCEC